MKRIPCSRLLLFASFIAGSLAGPLGDPDPADKDLSLIDRTIIEEILNSRRSKVGENLWHEMMSRSPYWNPYLMGYAGCPCSANPYLPMMGGPPPPPPPFFSYPFYSGVGPQYRCPEFNAASPPPPPSSYQPNQSTELQTRMLPDFMYGPLTHYQSLPPAEESSVQQKGLLQAIRSRVRTEIAAMAAKINPVDPPAPSTATPSSGVRQSAIGQRSATLQSSSTTHQPRSTKSNPRQ